MRKLNVELITPNVLFRPTPWHYLLVVDTDVSGNCVGAVLQQSKDVFASIVMGVIRHDSNAIGRLHRRSSRASSLTHLLSRIAALHSMQGTALRRTSVISAGAAFGRYGTTRRSIASSTASLSTVPTSEATRRSSDDDVIYVGPLTQTFRRLKLFSLSSLALAGSLSPFIFIVESSLPSTARVALAATALATSGVSTALVAWCGKPYQQHTTHSHNENAPAGIELTTLTLALTPRATRVYDPAFLGDATRAFARWELARSVQLPP
ncbi:hypothetical protein EDB92DRAFT_1943757 [Lactarius akahatsu]|uniref:Uncharacterized protein n=1 Tax=Lactarius akahatsu TaxID=416441 RepID=A0AAD4LIW2_9AGAM|nr:hypothetical protein EDB92DRAFT_1943757 [Lactarius akahatsu]